MLQTNLVLRYLGVAAAVCSWGCSTRGYDEQMEKTLQRLNNPMSDANASSQLADYFTHDHNPFGGTQVNIRIPAAFKTYFQQGTFDERTGQIVVPRKVFPPGTTNETIKLPGFKICYEATEVDGEGGELPYYLYLCVSSADVGANFLGYAEGIHSQVLTEYPETPDQWESESVGKGLTWLRLRVEARQDFYRYREGSEPALVKLDGWIELWVHQKGKHRILVGWRTPAKIAGTTKLERLARLSAASLKME